METNTNHNCLEMKRGRDTYLGHSNKGFKTLAFTDKLNSPWSCSMD